ncbi:MAG: hypothetical protein OXM56_03575 [Gammaproteobacteria bacterium]|nr:hypothetical protein [Gammaproteobacteria bacterium]
MKATETPQPSYDTSLLGVAVAAAQHFGLDRTPAEAFVLSGHAFALNIHPDLCPSGPYCWDFGRSLALLANLGLEMRELGALPPTADPRDKRRLEDTVRRELERGAVCSLLNLDHQIVTGCDAEGFVLARPWGSEAPSTPARLTFGTWDECQSGPPVAFYRLAPCAAPSETPLGDALDFALEAWRDPGRMTEAPYRFGPEAYGLWLAALGNAEIDEHGNWWNASVWAECRAFAARYFSVVSPEALPEWLPPRPARELGERYAAVADRLRDASDRTRASVSRHDLVAEARDIEADCIERLERLSSG